jgi:hypothetical protein
MAKMTFVLDDQTVHTIRTLAHRKQRPQSHIVREAVAVYARQDDKLDEQARARKLGVLDRLLDRPATRPQMAVDAELRGIRRARRTGWRRPSD